MNRQGKEKVFQNIVSGNLQLILSRESSGYQQHILGGLPSIAKKFFRGLSVCGGEWADREEG